MPFKISAPSGEAAAMPNGFLPHSRTCFFNLMYVLLQLFLLSALRPILCSLLRSSFAGLPLFVLQLSSGKQGW